MSQLFGNNYRRGETITWVLCLWCVKSKFSSSRKPHTCFSRNYWSPALEPKLLTRRWMEKKLFEMQQLMLNAVQTKASGMNLCILHSFASTWIFKPIDSLKSMIKIYVFCLACLRFRTLYFTPLNNTAKLMYGLNSQAFVRIADNKGVLGLCCCVQSQTKDKICITH